MRSSKKIEREVAIYSVRQIGDPGSDAQILAAGTSAAAEGYAKREHPPLASGLDVFLEVALTQGASTVYAYWRVQSDPARPGEFLLFATNYATAVSSVRPRPL